MVPPTFQMLLVKQLMTLVDVRCGKCGCRRVLPRTQNTERLESVRCRRCDQTIFLRRVAVK